MRLKVLILFFIGMVLACLLGSLLYRLPPVYDRLGWRVDNLRTQIKYALNPPDEAVFVPQSTLAPTFTFPSQTPQPSPTATLPAVAGVPSPTAEPSPLPTITATPLPEKVILAGVKYEDQHNRWNYCGPANLSMALTFWGWEGDRDIVGKYVKPEDKDKNVMPYELQDFVATQTEGMRSVMRYGGSLQVLKRLIAGGFPVLVEKGYFEVDYTGKLGWMGHYQYVNGYDDGAQTFTLQDTYVKDGKDHQVSYAEFEEGWRSFNYVFLVIYPAEKEAEVAHLLGEWNDPLWANQQALQKGQQETQQLTGIQQYFAWFNVGSALVNLQAYNDAAAAFDYAFHVYANLPDEEAMRPYRLMWYQTSPYWAYYYSGRYQDVINLATTTLEKTISEPVLEESFYWRGLAREAVGDLDGALADLREAVRLNPNFRPGHEQLERLGAGGG